MPDGTYRMVVCTGHGHAESIAVAEQQVTDWLKAQHYDAYPEAVPDRPTRDRVGEQAVLDRDVGGGPGTGIPAFARWRLREYTPQGIWQTLLVLCTPPGRKGRSWIRLDSELLPAQRGGSQQTPGKAPVPRLARGLLDRFPSVDGPHRGAARVHAMSTVIEPDDVDEVLDELCDPERRLPIIVASTPSRTDFDEWLAGTVDPVLRGCAGLAVLYALSPRAEREFNRSLEHHRVYGGAVRTYLPGIDPAWPAEAQRHRVLARRTIDEDIRRAAGLVAWVPRRQALDCPLPDTHLDLPELAVPTTAEAPDLPPGALFDGGEDRADAGERRSRSSELQDMRRRLREAERQEQLLAADYDDQYSELRDSRRTVRTLRRRLLAAGHPEDSLAPRLAEQLLSAERLTEEQLTEERLTEEQLTEEQGADAADQPPASFAELLGRLGEFSLLRFTGDAKEALDLDGQTDHPTWVRMTWDALLALQDYAEAAAAGTSGGDFRWWCENTPGDCHPFPPRKVIRDESRTVSTNAKWKRERLFPVPAEVDPAGKVFMGAHLRIGGGGTAPRLHYRDDCSGTGRIYLGYIGLHLHNTRTN
jgi:hypothetical protein